MNAQDTKRLQACVQEISEILYRNTSPEQLSTLDSIEQAVRQHMLKEVSPKVGLFLSKRAPVQPKGKHASSKAVSENCDLKPNN